MLFNSYIFIFIFLPIVLIGFHIFRTKKHYRTALGWLVGTSLFFYGWWNPRYLGLIFVSIIFNYFCGGFLREKPSKYILFGGVAINLGLIGYFKYADFFLNNLNVIINTNLNIEEITLPLAISFFTFQQITYLVDSYQGGNRKYSFLKYCLFVTFFPQLIAGPIVHHKEILPQFKDKGGSGIQASHLSVGITLFMLGLFKKVVFADTIAMYANPVFEAANQGSSLTLFEAWSGALAYSFQLYFDFSGYSDMATGLARMFGVVLPVNFYSPYKANSIIEFWRRWHITLYRFLRDYLYIPLGGNRKGNLRRYLNLMITMLLGGLWHGAGWTFIIWGGIHGFFLALNNLWRTFREKIFSHKFVQGYTYKIFGRIITFLIVIIAWVMFKSDTVDGAINMYHSMFGFNGISLPIGTKMNLSYLSIPLKTIGVTFDGMFHNGILGSIKDGMAFLFILLCIVWFSPNSLDLLRNENPALNLDRFIQKDQNKRFVWRYNFNYAFILAVISAFCILSLSAPSEFLYFQF